MFKRTKMANTWRKTCPHVTAFFSHVAVKLGTDIRVNNSLITWDVQRLSSLLYKYSGENCENILFDHMFVEYRIEMWCIKGYNYFF